MKRDPKTQKFLKEIEGAHHTYSRFNSDTKLLTVVGERLREHIKTTYSTEPRKAQVEQARLTRQSASPFEREPVDELLFEDLDADIAREMVAAAEDTDPDRIAPEMLPRLLLSRGYLWRDGQVLRPTVAGALLLARHPTVALPQSRIEVDAFPGTDRTVEAVDSEILEGPLLRLVKQAVAFVRRNTAKPLVVRGLKRQKTETYPGEVLREAVVNAVAHRDYSDAGAKIAIELYADRLIISSPGDPPGGQTADILASGNARSRSRNPLIVQGLAWLQFMDERGSGISRMKRLLAQAGIARPSFRIEHDSLELEIRAARGGTPAGPELRASESSTDTGPKKSPDQEILDEVRASGSISTKFCVQRLGIPRATAQRLLSKLAEEQIVQKIGSGPSTQYRLKDEAM